MSLISELKRRNVFRIAGIYAVAAWVLMQIAGTLEESLNLPQWFDSVITAGLLIGFPIALLLAWAFEMTPEGVKRTESVDGYEDSNQKLEIAILLGLLLLIGVTIWQKTSGGAYEANTEFTSTSIVSEDELVVKNNSIAVLAFTDLSQDGDQEYFSDGIAEEILNVLVKVDALKVTSRTSAFQFKGRDLGIPEIAKQLNVRHVVEGSVRKSGKTIRITAQLIDAQDDKHLWSDTFDRPLSSENIFAIQDEISNAIVKALKKELGFENLIPISVKPNTENLNAYELYLKARPLFLARNDLDKADAMIAQAIELDPNFAQAWAMRAALQSLMDEYGYSKISRQESDQAGLDYANHALTLDQNTALAYAVKAKIRMNANEQLRGQFDYAEIIADFNKSLALDPHNASTLNWLGLTYQHLGFLEQSAESYNKCIEYEPRYNPCYANLLFLTSFRGHDEISLQLLSDGLSIGVLDVSDVPFRVLARHDLSIAFMMALNTEPYFQGWHRIGEIYQAFQNLEADHSKLLKDATAYISNKPRWQLGFQRFILTPLGYFNPEYSLDPFLYEYRLTSENFLLFKQHIKKSGTFKYWQEHGYPPICRAIGDDDFECDNLHLKN